MEGAGFTYPGSDSAALEGVSVLARTGSRIAVVGPIQKNAVRVMLSRIPLWLWLACAFRLYRCFAVKVDRVVRLLWQLPIE